MFKSQWGRAGTSLARLSGAQKITTVALLGVMIATIVWLTGSRAKVAMEPVLDQPFADADVVQISDHLTARAVAHVVRDGKVFVPADRKLDVLSDLIYSDLLTGNTESGFDALIKQTSVWDTPSKTDKMFNRAREATLERVIGRFRGVRKATVIIDPTHERHISGSVIPSAMVDIQTRGERGANDLNPRQLANAVANALTGAVSTMSREKVMVTIDGASYNAGGAATGRDLATAGDVLERRQQCEQVYVSKVRQQLKFIPDVLVSVSVDLNLQSQEEEKRVVDPDNFLQSVTKVQTRSEQNDPSAVDPEPGALANAVPTIPEKPAPPKIPARSADSTTEYAVHASETIQKTRTPAGKETIVSASVAVPRSYLVGIYQRAAAKQTVSMSRPDDASIQPVVDVQLAKIRNLVRTTLGLKAEDVTVEVYEDAAPTAAAPAPAAAVATTLKQPDVVATSAALVMAHWRAIVYGAAGTLTVVMASMVLRRGSGNDSPSPRGVLNGQPQLALAAASPRVRVPRAAAARTIEQEMDDNDDTRDLLRQVRELAMRQPDDAARVLREWIYED